jgi:hypothetical protein
MVVIDLVAASGFRIGQFGFAALCGCGANHAKRAYNDPARPNQNYIPHEIRLLRCGQIISYLGVPIISRHNRKDN